MLWGSDRHKSFFMLIIRQLLQDPCDEALWHTSLVEIRQQLERCSRCSNIISHCTSAWGDYPSVRNLNSDHWWGNPEHDVNPVGACWNLA